MNKPDVIATDRATNKKPQGLIQVGLSACLAGHNVRYNGGHTQSRLCLNKLIQHFTFHAFCPEVSAGFSTPRPAMRLTGDPSSPQLVFSNAGAANLREQLNKGISSILPKLSTLDGYILMKNSPTCGLERVKVYQPDGHPHAIRTAGLFTQALTKQYPLMPIEEEGRLHDDKLLDNFLLRVYAYSNFRREVLNAPSMHKLISFHSSYKYVLMAHNQKIYRYLGQLLNGQQKGPLEQLLNNYLGCFMQALAKPADRNNHANTLLHILGYLKKSVSSMARQQIVEVIYKYKQGIVPLTTPLTLLAHYLTQYGSSYIKGQRYLAPYPESLNPLARHI